jgi:saccharopine dehydrogenase-like NADP-dependent oxidoreductase
VGGKDATRKPKEVAFEIYNLLNEVRESGKFWKQGKWVDGKNILQTHYLIP